VKYIILLAQIFIIIFNINSLSFAGEAWEQITGLNETNLKDVAIDPYNNGIIYVAGQRTVHKKDEGKMWKTVFSVPGKNDTINSINISNQGAFICTTNGLFRSDDKGLNWKRIFKGVGKKENDVSHIAFSGDKRIYIGTGSGLFMSNDNGLTWQKDGSESGSFNIRWVEFMDGIVFLAAEKGVYKNSGSGWKRTFVTGTEDKEYDSDITDESQEAMKPVNSIAAHNDIVLLATDSGIFESQNKGETWNRFNQEGLISLHVSRLLFQNELYAATDKGVFIYSEKSDSWRPLYKGMNTKDIRGITMDIGGDLWAATKKGLYKAIKSNAILGAENSLLESKRQVILSTFENEPCIRDVQEAAIKYAEVHPDKIKAWRESAKKKALLPNVSVGLDRYVTDYWHWDSGTNPDTLQKGKDAVSWDISMSWNMGELIWNDDQTSIDTRSKLMVELRDDIMDEVTRTYFERRRLQIEMLTSPPQDLKLSLEKELRLQELTADIDALTGGYFSESLQN